MHGDRHLGRHVHLGVISALSRYHYNPEQLDQWFDSIVKGRYMKVSCCFLLFLIS